MLRHHPLLLVFKRCITLSMAKKGMTDYAVGAVDDFCCEGDAL